MIRLRTAATVLALAVTLTGCATAVAAPEASDTITVEHAQGSTQVKKNPAKVVVLDTASLDTLDALDLESRVVGVPKVTLPETLSVYAQTQQVGTAQEPDVEAIAKLGPDAIIIGGRSAAKYAELAEVAPTIDLTVNNAAPLESLTKNTEALGTLFDASDKAKDALADVSKAVDSAKAATQAAAKSDQKALIVLTSGGKVSAFGPGARFGSLIHDVLGVPAAATNLEASQHGQAISFEFIAETKPDLLFVVDRDAAIGQKSAPAKQVLDNPLVARTPAWTNNKVAYLDGTDWYLIGFGVNATQRMVKSVQDAVGA